MRDRTLIAVAALSLTCFASAQAQADNNRNAGGNNERHGILQLVKTCPNYNFKAGDYCAVIQSNIAEIPPNLSADGTPPPNGGTVNFYTMSGMILPNVIDSNVVLDAGNGNRATGRCTFDGPTNTGLCQYTDGTGTLAGFSARLEVTPDPAGDLNSITYFLTGPYVFKDTSKPPS
jgi:hypothetical protein